jgi:hypothetical protein
MISHAHVLSISAPSPNIIPKCCMAHSQLSFHGHRDAVKFFVSVPMSPVTDFPLHLSKKPDMLVMSKLHLQEIMKKTNIPKQHQKNLLKVSH